MLLLLAERMKVKEFITKKPFVIAGPCSAETEEQTIEIAKAVEGVADVFRAGIWKPRTSPNSFEAILATFTPMILLSIIRGPPELPGFKVASV